MPESEVAARRRWRERKEIAAVWALMAVAIGGGLAVGGGFGWLPSMAAGVFIPVLALACLFGVALFGTFAPKPWREDPERGPRWGWKKDLETVLVIILGGVGLAVFLGLVVLVLWVALPVGVQGAAYAIWNAVAGLAVMVGAVAVVGLIAEDPFAAFLLLFLVVVLLGGAR